MNTKKNQPFYSEAKQQAIKDIKEQLHEENKPFIEYNKNITININLIIGSDCKDVPVYSILDFISL